MAKPTTPAVYVDAQGQVVPAAYVKPYDKARDRIARRILRRFEEERARLEKAYQATLQDIDELATLAGREGITVGGAKGNLQFQSFDRLIQIGMDARYNVEFDERLRAAQEKIEAFVKDRAAGADNDLRELVMMAFKPTSDGLLSRARILGLLRLNIRHASWEAAMTLIRESINTERGKTLLRVEKRATREADFVRVILSLSDVAAGGKTDGESLSRRDADPASSKNYAGAREVKA